MEITEMTEFSLMTAAQQTATINDMMAGCVRSAMTIANHLRYVTGVDWSV